MRSVLCWCNRWVTVSPLCVHCRRTVLTTALLLATTALHLPPHCTHHRRTVLTTTALTTTALHLPPHCYSPLLCTHLLSKSELYAKSDLQLQLYFYLFTLQLYFYLFTLQLRLEAAPAQVQHF